MRPAYDYRNCQSLFGYAKSVHIRSKAVCMLCGCDAGNPPDFDLWRQMTVEHLIGASQGGYPSQIKPVLAERFPLMSEPERDTLLRLIDDANTVTACSFCNSSTSRDRHTQDMKQLLVQADGTAEQVVKAVIVALDLILERKRAEVAWKLQSVRRAFDEQILPALVSQGVTSK